MEHAFLTNIGTAELWSELAKRFNVKFGKIQIAIHNGKPSKYAQIDMKVTTDDTNDSARASLES